MRIIVGGLLVAALLVGMPAGAYAQFQEVPPVIFTGPLSHPRYEDGGFFVGLDFLYLRSENTIGNQTIAKRGFMDLDGSITGHPPPEFVGDGVEALNTQQLSGPRNYSPGFDLSMGYRFDNGVVVQLTWWHLADHRMSAGASILPGDFNVGKQLENTFLYSPVFNFTTAYAGNPRNVNAGDPGATYGIWNAASEMTIDLLERFDLFEVNGRIPILQTDNYRSYGIVGPRAVIMWQRFKWRTVDMNLDGGAGPNTTAIYSNVVSNRLYGAFAGCGNEWFLGTTPIGGFSVSLDLEGALYLDIVKQRARYELGDGTTAATRARNNYTLAPGLQGKFGFWWYPWEAITLHAGWDALLFFNTVTSRNPVDFNLGSVNPEYDRTVRYFHGLQLGIGLVF